MVSNLDETFDRVAELRARSERYRLLAETLFDPNMIAVAEGCACELEAAATAQDPRTTHWK